MVAATGSSRPSGDPGPLILAGFSGSGSRMALVLVFLMMIGGLFPLAAATHQHGGYSPTHFRLNGRVLDDDTGGGLANATLTLVDPWAQEVANLTSGPGGHFGSLIPAGDYQVRIERSGYYGLESWISERWSDHRHEEYRLFPLIPPNATVQGHINDTVGLPMAGVEVTLNLNNLWHPQGHVYHSRMVTNSTGNYSFAMAAGDYNLDVELDSHFHEGWGFYANNGSAYYQNFTLQSYTENALVKGYLLEPDLSPAVPAQIQLNRDWGYWNQTNGDNSGYYEMWVAPGNYTGYQVWGEGYNWTDNWSLSLSLAANSTTWFNATVYPLPDAIFVSGTVYDLNKQPIENATVRSVTRQSFYGPNPGEYLEVRGVRNITTTGTNGNFLMYTYQGATSSWKWWRRATTPRRNGGSTRDTTTP